MHFLFEEGYFIAQPLDPAGESNAQRRVQIFLKLAGYQRGEHTAAALKLSPVNDLLRAEYVQLMTEGEPTARRTVYIDENYIHQHYSSHNDSLFDPTDPSGVKPKHKGRYLCFIAAIIDDDKSISADARAESQPTRLLVETIDIFEGGNQTVDYHGMFCHAYFVAWMARLLQRLKDRGITRCHIVVDNAKYHKSLPDSVLRCGSKKQIMMDACEQYGIAVVQGETKLIIWGKLSEYIRTNIEPIVVAMAKAEGHRVVFTPPHHSDLQSIEIVWALIKGTVGRQYTANTTFADIRRRLDAAFKSLQPSTVQKCIDATGEQLLDLKNYLEVMEGKDESQDEDEDEEDSE